MKLGHDVEGKGIHAQRGELERRPARPICVDEIFHKFFDTGVVAGTERAESEIVEACVLDQRICITAEPFERPLPVRPVDHACLAETAAADAAPLDLHHSAVLRDLNKRNQLVQRIRRRVQISHRLLYDPRGNTGNVRREGSDRTVLLIGYRIERWHIDARHLRRRGDQELPAALSRCLHGLIKIQKLIIYDFPFAYIEHIEEFGDRLRIIRAGAASDHDRIRLIALRSPQGDSGKVQDLQHICVAEFELERNSQEVKIPNRVL